MYLRQLDEPRRPLDAIRFQQRKHESHSRVYDFVTVALGPKIFDVRAQTPRLCQLIHVPSSSWHVGKELSKDILVAGDALGSTESSIVNVGLREFDMQIRSDAIACNNVASCSM